MNNIIAKAGLLNDYENAILEKFSDYKVDDKVTFLFSELGKKSEGGLPFIVKRNDKGDDLEISFMQESHGLVIGATRSGKTSGYIIPIIIIKANQKIKDNMFISDPKGELYKNTSEALRKQGYEVVLINLRDQNHSEYWNPLTPIFRKHQEAMKIYDEVRVVKKFDTYVYQYGEDTFETEEEMKGYMEEQKGFLLYEVIDEIDKLSNNLIQTFNSKDPFWEDIAKSLFKGFLFAMLEDSDKDRNIGWPIITEKTFSFRTMLNIFSSMHFITDEKENRAKLVDDGYFTQRKSNSKARQTVETIINSPVTTGSCILSSFEAKMKAFREAVANQITSANSFDLDELLDSEKPLAIYMIYRDETKVSYEVLQQFISSLYANLIERSYNNSNLKIDRPFYFMLDEFGNLPKIADFETKISASGGRDIWFVLGLQSYSQLYNVYGKETGEIIKDNLNMHIFMGTNNPETKKAFSEECGRKTIISPVGVLRAEGLFGSSYEKETIALVPLSMLNKFDIGECIVTRFNSQAVLLSRLERYYLCDQLQTDKADSTKYKNNPVDFTTGYDYMEMKREMEIF